MTNIEENTTKGFWRVRPEETRALWLSFAYFFFVLATYYVLRPVRDEMGIRSGVGNLPWLFTATFVVNLIVAPIYAALVGWLKRSIFIPAVYGFLILNIVAFWSLLTGNIALAETAVVFFVWITVFSVFAVSVFWSFMADVFQSGQAKRLYPIIAAGGSLGGFAGSATVTGLAKVIGPANLLIVAAVLLSLALICAVLLEREPIAQGPGAKKAEQAVGGGWLAGLITILRSPYLAGIALWVVMLGLANGFAYFMQAEVISNANLDSASRTQIFGAIDLATNILIPLLQLTVTGFLLQKLGVGPTLAGVAIVVGIGFLALAASPVLTVIIALQVALRASGFAISNPAREALWPVVDREEKYKAKNVVDNVVFRGSDVGTAWLFNALKASLGLGISAIALIGAAIAAAWLFLSLGLGRAQARKALQPGAADGAAP